MKAIRVLTLLCLSLLAACSSHPTRTVMPRPAAVASDAVESVAAQSEWKSRPADEVAPGFEIQTFSIVDSRLNGTFRLDQDGVVKLPYGVSLNAAGLTLSELSSKINSAMSQFVKSPGIKVEITKKEFYVDVQGLVKKPGQYLVKKNSTIDELISLGGGLETGTAAPQYARIDQLGVSNMVKLKDYYAGRKDLVPQWQGGEIVFFQAERGDVLSGAGRNYVQLLGQYKNPGEYPYEGGSDFYDYLIRAGGPTERADMYNIDLVRLMGNDREVVNFQLSNYKEIPAIRSGDTIILHADNPSRIEKESRVVGGFTSIITAIATTILLFTKI